MNMNVLRCLASLPPLGRFTTGAHGGVAASGLDNMSAWELWLVLRAPSSGPLLLDPGRRTINEHTSCTDNYNILT